MGKGGAGMAAWPPPSPRIAALLLLGGAVGQIGAAAPARPGYRDAMAGPTPVSALIHAATDGHAPASI